MLLMHSRITIHEQRWYVHTHSQCIYIRNTQTHTHTHSHSHTPIHMSTHPHTHTHTHTHTQTNKLSCRGMSAGVDARLSRLTCSNWMCVTQTARHTLILTK